METVLPSPPQPARTLAALRPNARPVRWRRVAAAAAILAMSIAGCWSAAATASADSAGTPSSESTTASFGAVADARVEEGNPAVNYGAATRLGSDGDPGTRVESHLRFALDGIRHTVRSATLRIYVVSDGSVNGPSVYPSDGDWSEDRVTWDTRPHAVGPAIARMGPIAAGTWVELDVTSAVEGDGDLDLLLAQSGTDGAIFYSRQGSFKPSLIVTSSDPVVMAAGDIACKPNSTVTAVGCRHGRTADLLMAEPWLTNVLMLGDSQYEDALYSEYVSPGTYDETWGRAKPITKPVPGNHEYHGAGAPGYFTYFEDAAAPASNGFYSFDLDAWHLVALNSEISTGTGSMQEKWLRADLAATDKACILAYWHRPRFSSGSHGNSPSLAPIWQALYDARADVVLNGHDHNYERFAPQDPRGQAAADGIREFVVGTGGANHGQIQTVGANSEVREANTFGVLRLALRGSSYDWTFVPEAGEAFTDSGSSDCHAFPPIASVTATPSRGLAPLDVTVDASASVGHNRTPIKQYSFDFGDGSAGTGPQSGPVATHTYTAAGTYTVTARVTDAAGQVGTGTTQVVVLPNMVGNSSFEQGLLGWNTSGSGPDVVLSQAAGGVDGEWAAQLKNTGSAPSSCVLNDSPNWVKVSLKRGYTGSLWARADVPGARLKLRFREWVGPTLLGSASSELVLTSSWQKAGVTYAPLASGFSTLDFNAYVVGAPPGTCFYADAALVSPD
jgi:acid phosphatase type 7